METSVTARDGGGALTNQLAEWGAFAALLGGAAATLMGLLFVAVSINGRAVAEMADREARMMAINTFAGFLFLLVYALFMLVPDQTLESLGWSLLITSVFQLRVTFWEAVRIWRAMPGGFKVRQAVREQALPLASALGIAVVGTLLLSGLSADLDLLLYAFFSLLIGCTLNSWFLLLRLSAPGVKV